MWKAALIVCAVLVPALAFAQDQEKKPDQKPDNCFYNLATRVIQIPIGGSICRRQPAPYSDKFSLLRCTPPLDEIDSDIKRGDPGAIAMMIVNRIALFADEVSCRSVSTD